MTVLKGQNAVKLINSLIRIAGELKMTQMIFTNQPHFIKVFLLNDVTDANENSNNTGCALHWHRKLQYTVSVSWNDQVAVAGRNLSCKSVRCMRSNNLVVLTSHTTSDMDVSYNGNRQWTIYMPNMFTVP